VQETGLKQDTLRAWERRYGVPNPERTPGGHRLYSQRDIDTLKWLVARQQEGLSISRAVDLWQRLMDEGKDPILEIEPAIQHDPASSQIAIAATGGNIDKMRDAWIEACLAFNEKNAEALLTQAAAMYSPEIICGEFLQKALAQIGQMWIDGQVTVQQEHFASTLAIRRLEALIAGSPNPTRPGRILAVCPPEELHIFSLLMATYLLRRNGWDTIFLGANVPLSHIEETIDTVRPTLAIMAAQQIFTAATLLQTAQILYNQNVPVAFGGRIFNQVPALQERIPGYFLGKQIDQVSDQVKQILSNLRMPSGALPVSDEYRQALTHFRERQPYIESAVWENVDSSQLPQVVLAYWNLNMARNISGALMLGDLSYLSSDLTWAKEMLINHNLPIETLYAYLTTYYHAADQNLDTQGEVIVAWLSQFANGKPKKS
jgi:DNA-binding transcriptional MerR regulator